MACLIVPYDACLIPAGGHAYVGLSIHARSDDEVSNCTSVVREDKVRFRFSLGVEVKESSAGPDIDVGVI